LATIEKRYLAPLNPAATITEADRSKAYDIIRRELADLLTGDQSYYPEGFQKDLKARASDLESFIASIADLQNRVNDPSNVLGKAVDDLTAYAKAFRTMIKGNEPVDHIEMPREWSPTTRDRNEMEVPDGGLFSPPNPLSPSQWPKDLRASTGTSDKMTVNGAMPGISPKVVRRVSSAFGSIAPPAMKQPAPSAAGRQSTRGLCWSAKSAGIDARFKCAGRAVYGV
jgi:hypothetical protein